MPGSIYENLQKAFRKAFAIVFEKGTGLIEKTYNRESLEEDCQVREFAFQVKANRKTLKKARKDARAGNLRNLAITSAEGIGLGAVSYTHLVIMNSSPIASGKLWIPLFMSSVMQFSIRA